MQQRTSRAVIEKRKRRNRRFRLVAGFLIVLLVIIQVNAVISGNAMTAAAKAARPEQALVQVQAQSQQPQLYNGCEVTSLSMLLQQAGKSVSKLELARRVRKDPSVEVRDAQGRTISWGDPNRGFVGDVSGAGRGYGVYHGPLAALMNQYLPGRVEDLSGSSFDAVLNAIAGGRPVVVWTTVNFAPTRQWVTWRGPNGDVKATFDEHAVLLVGYAKDTVSVIDPLSGTQKTVARAAFQTSWEQMGAQAVTYKEKGTFAKTRCGTVSFSLSCGMITRRNVWKKRSTKMTTTTSFHTYDLPEYQLAALEKAGLTKPTPIQEQAIPLIQAGRDVVGQSRTGSGKTLAFVLPMLQKIDTAKRDLQALILVPSRELSVQIEGEIRRYTEGTEIRSQALVGGANIERQIEKLREKPHIVVGTPGRIIDILKRKKLKLHEVKTITLDEIDQMLALGSMRDVETILKSTLRDRQLLFFSATVSDEAKKYAAEWMQDPVFLETEAGDHLGKIEHVWFGTNKTDKPDTLRRLIRAYNADKVMVFVNETDRVWWLVGELRDKGFTAEGLHGEAAKIQREKAMNGFRDGKYQVLVTTDLGGRGLDVEGVTHVFHFDPATDAEHYLHRSGRTGRGTASGVSVSIVAPDEKFIIRKFENALKISILSKGIEQGKIFTRRPGRTTPQPAASGKKKSSGKTAAAGGKKKAKKR